MRMYDPHVDWLLYQVEHDTSVDYSKADSLDHEERTFRVRVETDRVSFTMKEHYATEEAARAAVEAFIVRWEFEAQLQRGPNTFSLGFLDSRVVDRAPNPPPTGIVPLSVSMRAGVPSLRVRLTVHGGYPAPPSSRITITPNVRSMYERFLGYRNGKEPLLSMAYFCLTVLESGDRPEGRGRQWAASNYQICEAVLSKIGELTSRRGGNYARKAEGMSCELAPRETQFLERAIKAVIRRAAEVSFDPDGRYRRIRLSGLPRIEESAGVLD